MFRGVRTGGGAVVTELYGIPDTLNSERLNHHADYLLAVTIRHLENVSCRTTRLPGPTSKGATGNMTNGASGSPVRAKAIAMSTRAIAGITASRLFVPARAPVDYVLKAFSLRTQVTCLRKRSLCQN
eukprot:5796515-Amphidinium_carterae.1